MESRKTALTDLARRNAALFKAAPAPMRAFTALADAATRDGALSGRHKELMCFAISIALRCEDCIAYHLSAAVKHGATRDEAIESIAVAVEMGGGPAVVYGGRALEFLDALTVSVSAST